MISKFLYFVIYDQSQEQSQSRILPFSLVYQAGPIEFWDRSYLGVGQPCSQESHIWLLVSVPGMTMLSARALYLSKVIYHIRCNFHKRKKRIPLKTGNVKSFPAFPLWIKVLGAYYRIAAIIVKGGEWQKRSPTHFQAP